MQPSIPFSTVGDGHSAEMGFPGEWLLLSPAGLLGLAAVAIPILIHLFSRSKGRRVLIGHIDLVRQSRQRRVTELRLSQWLLLILRLLIIIITALILAQLARKGVQSTDVDTVYVTQAWLDGADEDERIELRAKAGSEVYLLAEDYPQLDDLAVTAAEVAPAADDIRPIWSLLAERLSHISHLAEVDVYTAGLALEFGHRVPALPRSVNWHSREGPISQHAPMPRALIIHDADRAADAASLQAALSVLRTHRLPGLRWDVLETGEITEIPPATDWLFTLSARPDDYARRDQEPSASDYRFLTWFSDAPAGEDRQSVVTAGNFPFAQFELYRASADALPGTPLWLDDTRRPVLSERITADVRRIHFSSRFHPSWSSLPRQSGFPETLLTVMLDSQQQELAFAATRVEPELMNRAGRLVDADTPLPNRPLQMLLALILVGLWVSERWLSERRRHAR